MHRNPQDGSGPRPRGTNRDTGCIVREKPVDQGSTCPHECGRRPRRLPGQPNLPVWAEHWRAKLKSSSGPTSKPPPSLTPPKAGTGNNTRTPIPCGIRTWRRAGGPESTSGLYKRLPAIRSLRLPPNTPTSVYSIRAGPWRRCRPSSPSPSPMRLTCRTGNERTPSHHDPGVPVSSLTPLDASSRVCPSCRIDHVTRTQKA
jgi:hypothetical protein